MEDEIIKHHSPDKGSRSVSRTRASKEKDSKGQ